MFIFTEICTWCRTRYLKACNEAQNPRKENSVRFAAVRIRRMRVQVHWKHLNEGDFQPVVCLDVQHVNLVAGDWEASVILNEMSSIVFWSQRGPRRSDLNGPKVLISIDQEGDLTLGTAQVMLISSVTLFSSLVSPDWWKRNLVKFVVGNGVCKTAAFGQRWI